ncbi:MAG: methyltransferase [Acidobacteriota bacterium]
MSFTWPDGFRRVPEDPWVDAEVQTLARKYDTVEAHGWYSNLDPTLDEMAAVIAPGDLVIDYSGGTGILADRFLARDDVPEDVGVVIVDASPKFLRVAHEKLSQDPRVGFRWIRYLREAKRLQRLDEVLGASVADRGVDLITSTNAIHLYYGLRETLGSWFRTLRPGGRVLVQSGNIRGASAPPGSWLIDETVGRIQSLAKTLVELDPRYSVFKPALGDPQRMARHDRLRDKYFLPVRALDVYLQHLTQAGFEIDAVAHRVVEARVGDWFEFLSAYHEGVLGWAGGTEKIDGEAPDAATVDLRLQLIREALERLFDHRPKFRACWTYITCTRPA